MNILPALITALALGFFSGPALALANPGSPIVISLGDSYSSGEGVPPFYGQEGDEKTWDEDWIAHRSQRAWPGQLVFQSDAGLLELNESRACAENAWEGSWYFVAASGATISDLYGLHRVSFSHQLEGPDGAFLEPQLAVFDRIPADEAIDCVTITIGGNDMGFAEVIAAALKGSSLLAPDSLPKALAACWQRFDEPYADKNGVAHGSVREGLRQAYRDIRSLAGRDTLILVMGYPQLIDPSGGELFDAREADLINEATSRLNGEIAAIVEELGDPNTVFVPVEDAFLGHGAYSDDPYINCVIYLKQQEDLNSWGFGSSYSIHPNEQGLEAYRAVAQRAIDERLADIPLSHAREDSLVEEPEKAPRAEFSSVIELVEMPDLIGMRLDKALATLAKLGFANVDYIRMDGKAWHAWNIESGWAVSHSLPAPSEQVSTGTHIVLYIYNVPNI